MASQLTFLALAEKVLREQKCPLSPGEIWKHAVAKGYSQQLNSDGKTPKATLYTVIYVDTKRNPDTIFYKAGERPARYFLKQLKDTVSSAALEAAVQKPDDDSAPEPYDYKEADLHPFMAYCAHLQFDAFTKTIKHQNSKKSEFGEWVHPDMIGVYFPFNDWCAEVLDATAATGNRGVKLYSFELKKKLNFSNLREAFFQAVSNSSWANEGYLAAAEISDDPDFTSELGRLSTSFGIGVIRLNVEASDSSGVVFPAKERPQVDWDTVNKLATMNKDVKQLLVRFKNDLSIKEVTKEQYDKILSPEDLSKLVKKTAP
jgi:hypothetical protein